MPNFVRRKRKRKFRFGSRTSCSNIKKRKKKEGIVARKRLENGDDSASKGERERDGQRTLGNLALSPYNSAKCLAYKDKYNGTPR